MSFYYQLSTLTHGFGYGALCRVVVPLHSALVGTGYPMEEKITALYKDILQDVMAQAKSYEDYLRYLADGGTPFPPIVWAEVRRQISAFSSARLVTEVATIQKVLEVECASLMEFPVPLLRQFVQGDRGGEVLAKIEAFSQRLLVTPFFKALALDDIWKALRFGVIDLCGGKESDLGALCVRINHYSAGKLFAMTEGYMDQLFQDLRKEVLIKKQVTLDGKTYEVVKVLGGQDGQGRGFLSCLSKSPDEKWIVLTFGPHPMSVCLRADPQIWALYEKWRSKRESEEPPHGWPLTWSRPWLFPPLPFDQIVEGVGISPFLHVLCFKGWATQNRPLSPSQEVLIRDVGKLFQDFQGLNILPDGQKEVKKLGVKFNGDGKILQIAPIALSPFTPSKAENLLRQIADEGLEIFKKLCAPFKEELTWDLRDRVEEISQSLIDSGDIPPVNEREIISDENFAQRNKVINVIVNLKDRGYERGAIGSTIGYWLKYTRVVLIEGWKRVEEDVKHLLEGQKDPSYPLPQELIPILQMIQADRFSQTKKPPDVLGNIFKSWF